MALFAVKLMIKLKILLMRHIKNTIKKTKTIMANFICDNGKTKANPKISLDPDEYSLIKAGCGGLYLTLRKK